MKSSQVVNLWPKWDVCKTLILRLKQNLNILYKFNVDCVIPRLHDKILCPTFES